MTHLRRLRARGHTLFEVMVASSIAVIILLAVGEVVATAARTQQYVTARDRAQSRASRVVADLRSAGLASRRFFQDDAEGRGYLAALDTAGFPVAAGSRLPLIEAGGRLGPDAPGVMRTGNAVLLACEDRPLDVETASGRVRRVDRVRFFGVYPTRIAERAVSSIPYRVDLVRFTSRPYADRGSLDGISDAADRADAVRALRAAGVDRAWLSGAAVGAAFFALNADGTVSATPVVSPVVSALPEDQPRLCLGASKTTVAPNGVSPKVPAFAAFDGAAPDFPGGFEVKAVGPSGGRQVLVRLVVVAGVQRSFDAVAETTRVFSVRDL